MTPDQLFFARPMHGFAAHRMPIAGLYLCGSTLLNVPIFVAAADHGCTDEQTTDAGYDGQRHVDFPDTCANGVASCGGTSLQSRGTVITSETVWNDNDEWATGGGVSTYFQNPTWQSGLVAEGSAPLLLRGVPDIAGNADPDTGVNMRANGNDSVSGGTSAVAPQWAALTAVVSQASRKRLAHSSTPIQKPRPMTSLSAITRCLE